VLGDHQAASTISRWPGIYIRAPGYRTSGYLAGPGSVVDGAEYVIDRDVPAAPLPRWLASLLTSPRRFRDTGADVEVSAVPGR
jgi:hypothetical protein